MATNTRNGVIAARFIVIAACPLGNSPSFSLTLKTEDATSRGWPMSSKSLCSFRKGQYLKLKHGMRSEELYRSISEIDAGAERRARGCGVVGDEGVNVTERSGCGGGTVGSRDPSFQNPIAGTVRDVEVRGPSIDSLNSRESKIRSLQIMTIEPTRRTEGVSLDGLRVINRLGGPTRWDERHRPRPADPRETCPTFDDVAHARRAV